MCSVSESGMVCGPSSVDSSSAGTVSIEATSIMSSAGCMSAHTGLSTVGVSDSSKSSARFEKPSSWWCASIRSSSRAFWRASGKAISAMPSRRRLSSGGSRLNSCCRWLGSTRRLAERSSTTFSKAAPCSLSAPKRSKDSATTRGHSRLMNCTTLGAVVIELNDSAN